MDIQNNEYAIEITYHDQLVVCADLSSGDSRLILQKAISVQDTTD